jgi:hypothetical protein
VLDQVRRIGEHHVEGLRFKLVENLAANTVVEGSAVTLEVRLQRHSVSCSISAPLTERFEQAVENRVFSIAID